MSIEQEDRALKSLTPQKYTIRLLKIAVGVLFSAFPGAFIYFTNQNAKTTEQLKQCEVSKIELSEKIRAESQKYDRERLDKAEAERRKSDSILMIVTLSQNAVKKAIKNEKSK